MGKPEPGPLEELAGCGCMSIVLVVVGWLFVWLVWPDFEDGPECDRQCESEVERCDILLFPDVARRDPTIRQMYSECVDDAYRASARRASED